jgi:alanine racemase
MSSRRASRPVWAEIDLAAVRHNARLLSEAVSPAALCAVVKADGYGHGAVAAGRAALEGGATWLAVASMEEGMELREAGMVAPVLVLSEPPPQAMAQVVVGGLTPAVYSLSGVEAAERAARGASTSLAVHVKVDTGMHRVGVDRSGLSSVLSAINASRNLDYAGLWTHLAVADGTSEEDRAFSAEQLRRFGELRREGAASGAHAAMAHAANSAATICYPESHLDMVRCGITLYGVLPSPALEDAFGAFAARAIGSQDAARAPGAGLRPALSLRAEVSCVRRLEAGERPSYGRLRALEVPSVVATVPVGYADGIPRRYFTEGGTVLVGGRRRPLAGAVTMDQIVVDCGPDAEVTVGDEVVLIGEQAGERITAWDWARVLGTISYEVLTGIGPRVERVLVDHEREEELAR